MTTADQIKAARKAGVDAAMSVAEDIATGKVGTAAMDAAVVAECRRLFGRVEGPGDPLWGLQVEVFRQVLAVGGGYAPGDDGKPTLVSISADELAEWVAVYRLAEGDAPAVGESWIERALAEGVGDDDG